jgi:hypothetical protein
MSDITPFDFNSDALEAWETAESRWHTRDAWHGMPRKKPSQPESSSPEQNAERERQLQALAHFASEQIARMIDFRRAALQDVARLQQELARQPAPPLWRTSLKGPRWLGDAIAKVASIGREYAHPDWDKGGERAVMPATVENALKLLHSLADALVEPEISADPDGYIIYEWQASPKDVVTVSIAPDGVIYYASLLNTGRSHGAERVEEAPSAVLRANLERFLTPASEISSRSEGG